MGLFSFAGKLIKGAASVLTHGLSDKAINAARAVIGGKPKQANAVSYQGPSTAQETALLAKLGPAPKPRVTMGVTEGWGFGKTQKGARAVSGKRRRPRQLAAERADAAAAETRRSPARARSTGKTSKRALPPALRAYAARSAQLAAEWRAAGGLQGTGQKFFDWKRGRS